MNKLKAVAVIGITSATMAIPAHAAFDYTKLTEAITTEVTSGLAFAGPALAVVLGATVGLKLAKKFFGIITGR